ncbi:MAG: AAA family ATPase [Ardenticatenaceae bacterium]|nr:AAA family ATPase [Anaerolineales bacterium]MCB8918446.1 AAA family ATPase [Ardenticatenaceae bacterium]
MSTLNPNIPSPELSRLMTTAAGRMADYQLKWLTPQLLLRTFLDDATCAAGRILQQLAQQRGFKLDELTGRVETMARHSPGRDARFSYTDDFGQNVPLADEMLVILDEGLTIAQAREELKVSSGHALAAMCDAKVTTYGALQRLGITQAAVITLLDEVTQDSGPVIHDYVYEAQQGSARPVYQRTELLRDLLSLLALAQKRHVILVGPEGAGKRTLAYSLAQLLAESNGPAQMRPQLRSLVEMNETALLENPLAAIRVALRRASGGVLLVPGIERFFADRLRARFPEQVNRELHKALLGNEQVILGTTTPAGYDQLARDPLIRQNSQRLEVPAATREETLAMLAYHQDRLAQEYEVQVSAAALETAANLASQYIKEIALPAGAVQLLDRACATVRLVVTGHVPPLPGLTNDNQLDSDDVMVAASLMTKIPIAKLSQDEQSRYANMVDHLHERIIGQEEAILAVSRAVKTARVGLRDPKRPIGSFLFLGPSGVGKSELAKALADFMFGSENAMLTLDMSEYQGEGSVNRLIGAPPGYIGYEGGGQLTDFIRQTPYAVILFDEVEKAHNRVFDVLLQVLDEGRLTDGQGRQVTFSEAVIIMTSNLGSRHMLVPTITDYEKELVMEEVRSFFRPEFLNRLDDVILFHQLTPDQLGQILGLLLKKEFRLAEKQGLTLVLSPAAKAWLLAQNDQPQFGARPLRRIIGRYLREPLADFLLRQAAAQQTTVQVDAGPAGLVFEMSQA